MKIGAHVSASGGLHNAPKNAAALGLECFQFFSRPPQGGPAPKLGDDEIRLFREACEQHGFDQYYIHTPYVLNIASDQASTRRNTVSFIRTDLERASLIGCEAIMTHLGSASKVGEEEGTKLATAGLREVLDGYTGSARLLIEISAGAGMILGDTFDELATVLDGVDDERVGICFDTAHAFASGYDLRDADAVKKTLDDFDRLIGLERLELSHANDSKIPLGERKDRHEHIGLGHIGTDGFRAIMSHSRFRKLNFILETPPGDGHTKDIAMLKALRDEIART